MAASYVCLPYFIWCKSVCPFTSTRVVWLVEDGGRVTFRALGERRATILKAFGAIIHTVGSQIQTWIYHHEHPCKWELFFLYFCFWVLFQSKRAVIQGEGKKPWFAIYLEDSNIFLHLLVLSQFWLLFRKCRALWF